MRGFLRFGVVVLSSLGITLAASAQQPTDPASNAGQAQATPSAPSGSPGRQVRLVVVVTDSMGRAVAGLQQQDFTVFDNDRRSTILSFHALSEAAPFCYYTEARAVLIARTGADSPERCYTADLDGIYFLAIEAIPANRPGEFRSLAVRVERPHLRVLTRMGYYAQP